MADNVDTLPPVYSKNLQKVWPAFVILGISLLGLGAIAGLNLFLATIAATFYVAVAMIVGGVLQIIHAFVIRKWLNSTLWLLGGILYLVAALAVYSDPVFAAVLLTLVFAVSLGVSGLFRLWAATGKDVTGRGWIIVSGLCSLAAALVVGMGWPFNTIWMPGLVLTIDLMFQGVALIFFGISLKAARLDAKVEPLKQQPA